MRTRITPNTDSFHAAHFFDTFQPNEVFICFLRKMILCESVIVELTMLEAVNSYYRFFFSIQKVFLKVFEHVGVNVFVRLSF